MITQVKTIIFFSYFIFMLGACKKSTNDDTSNFNISVSGKIKRIIYSDPVHRKASIKTFEYDGNNRITKLNYWMEDSSYTPIAIPYQANSLLSYSGLNEFPNKNIITHESGWIDSTLFYYDSQNRVTQEDFLSANQVAARNTYSYISAGTVLNKYYVLTGSTLQLSTSDSLFYDLQNKLLEIKSYANNGSYRGNSLFEYDNKINPLARISAFNYIYSLTSDDFGLNNKAPNNLLKIVDNQLSSTYITNYSLNYSLNSFPISGTSTTNTSSTSSTIKYEYY